MIITEVGKTIEVQVFVDLVKVWKQTWKYLKYLLYFPMEMLGQRSDLIGNSDITYQGNGPGWRYTSESLGLINDISNYETQCHY